MPSHTLPWLLFAASQDILPVPDPVNGREDKEALGEYDRAEQEFVKSLYTLAEAVMKRKECTVIYDFLSESGTLTNSRISMLAFLAAIEKTRIW